MPFVKANMEKEREELNRLIETDPEARKAHEEFMAQYERRKQLAEAEKKEGRNERGVLRNGGG